MPSKYIDIPITNHDASCTSYYLVEWKLTTDTGYNTMNWAVEPPIRIEPLLDNSEYNYRITRFCCNGSQSTPLTGTVDTTTDSPILDQPINFAVTPGVEQLALNCDDVTDAEEYVFEVAEDDEFTVNLQVHINATSDVTVTGLTTGTLYYCRVKARASGFQDSPYSDTDTGTPS